MSPQVRIVGFTGDAQKCLISAMKLLPDLSAIKEIRTFDHVLPEHVDAIYGEFEREFQREWPGNCKYNNYAALNWKGYVYVNVHHDLFGGLCRKADTDGVAALLAHEIWHIQSESNYCANEPWCLFEHELLAAIVEDSVRSRNKIIDSSRMKFLSERVFGDYIKPLETRCSDKTFADKMFALLHRRFVNNCKRRDLLTNDNSIDVKRYDDVIRLGSDHFHNKIALAPKGTEWTVMDYEEEEELSEGVRAVPTTLVYQPGDPIGAGGLRAINLPKLQMKRDERKRLGKSVWDLVPSGPTFELLKIDDPDFENEVDNWEDFVVKYPITATERLFKITDPSVTGGRIGAHLEFRRLQSSDLITTLLNQCHGDRHPNDKPPPAARSKRTREFHYMFAEGLAQIDTAAGNPVTLQALPYEVMIEMLQCTEWREMLCEWAEIRTEIGLDYFGFLWNNLEFSSLEDVSGETIDDLETYTKTMEQCLAFMQPEIEWNGPINVKIKRKQLIHEQRGNGYKHGGVLDQWLALQEKMLKFLSRGPLLIFNHWHNNTSQAKCSQEQVVPANDVWWYINNSWQKIDRPWSKNSKLYELLGLNNPDSDVNLTAMILNLDDVPKLRKGQIGIHLEGFDPPGEVEIDYIRTFTPGTLERDPSRSISNNQPYNLMMVLEILGLAWYPCRAHTSNSCIEDVLDLRNQNVVDDAFRQTLCAYWQYYHNPCAVSLRKKGSRLGKFNCVPVTKGGVDWSWGTQYNTDMFCPANNAPLDLDSLVELNMKNIFDVKVSPEINESGLFGHGKPYPKQCNPDVSCPFSVATRKTKPAVSKTDDPIPNPPSETSSSSKSSSSSNYTTSSSETSSSESSLTGTLSQNGEDTETSSNSSTNIDPQPDPETDKFSKLKKQDFVRGVWIKLEVHGEGHEVDMARGVLTGLGLQYINIDPTGSTFITGTYARKYEIQNDIENMLQTGMQHMKISVGELLAGDHFFLSRHHLLPYFSFEPVYVPVNRDFEGRMFDNYNQAAAPTFSIRFDDDIAKTRAQKKRENRARYLKGRNTINRKKKNKLRKNFKHLKKHRPGRALASYDHKWRGPHSQEQQHKDIAKEVKTIDQIRKINEDIKKNKKYIRYARTMSQLRLRQPTPDNPTGLASN